MSKKNKTNKKMKALKDQEVIENKNSKSSNSLIFGGVLLAIISIGLLIFVLSEKVFHLS